MERQQNIRTNHLGLDVAFGRKLPGGVLYYATRPARSPAAISSALLQELWRGALRVLSKLLLQFDSVMDAIRSVAVSCFERLGRVAVVEEPEGAFQIRVTVDRVTELLNASADWTENEVKAALAAKLCRSFADCYIVVNASGTPLNDGDTTTRSALGVRKDGRLELLRRPPGGGCSASKSTVHPLLADDEAAAHKQVRRRLRLIMLWFWFFARERLLLASAWWVSSGLHTLGVGCPPATHVRPDRMQSS